LILSTWLLGFLELQNDGNPSYSDSFPCINRIHAIQTTNALMLKFISYTHFAVTPTCFGLALSSSGS